MIETIANILKGVSPEVVTVILGALPISEVRGAIPAALAMKLTPASAFLYSVLGNSIIIVPTLLLLEPVSKRMRAFKAWRKFFDWLFEKTRSKGDIVERYEALGLAIFVAIPLPMTGAWSGCIAASLFKIKFRYAFTAIFLGVIIAACIVMAISLFGMEAFRVFTT